MTRLQNEARIKQLWLDRPEASRKNMIDVMKFNVWVRQHHPHLFSHLKEIDSYQQLKSILRGHLPELH